MNLFLIKIILVTLVAVATTFVGIKLEGSPYVLAIIIAIATLFSIQITDVIALNLSDPKVTVTIKEEKKGEILVQISKGRDILANNIDIAVHTLGPVKNIHDLNDRTTFGGVEKRVTGFSEEYAQNTTEIALRDVSGSSLQFKILYEPIPMKIEIPGTDQYKYRYTWSFNGNLQEKRKVRSVYTNEDVTPSPVSVVGTVITPRVLGKEDIKKEYESGPPIRIF